MVELGTGYFAEKTIPDAKDLIDRKVSFRFHHCCSLIIYVDILYYYTVDIEK